MREHITFGFVGIGLIGGSVAKALRRVYPSCKIIVYNRSAEPRVMAINDGTANIAVPQVNETFNECDYIFLCNNVEKNVEYLKILKDIIKDDCIITDVGSVKGNIHKAVEELGLQKNFIGGHPMAGSEKTSYTMLMTVWLKMHTMPLLLQTLLVKSVLKSLLKSFRVLGLFQLIYHMKNMIR